MLRNWTAPTRFGNPIGPGGGVSGGAPPAVGPVIATLSCTSTPFHHTLARALAVLMLPFHRAAWKSMSKVSHVPAGRAALVEGSRCPQTAPVSLAPATGRP